MDSVSIITNALNHEIEHGTQRSVGALYGMLILSSPSTPTNKEYWRPINRAIMERWPNGGAGGAMDRVKAIGWKVATAATKPATTAAEPPNRP